MYSLDVKKIIICMYNKIKSLRYIQSITNVSKSTISRWKNELSTNIKSNSNCRIPIIIDSINLISNLNYSYTINDVQIYIYKHLGIKCSYQLIRTVMRNKMNLSYKKTKYFNFMNEKLLIEKTKLFHDQFKKLFKGKLIASIDEVGFSSKVNTIYSWSDKGKRTYIKNKIESGKRINKSVCCCITSSGKISYNCKSSPYNKISFITFLKSLKLPSNTVILLDNVSFHHSKDVKDYIKKRNWIALFTPPYSPWFNPIENIFSMVKNQFRKNKIINDSFGIVKKQQIINIFNHTVKTILNNDFLL